MAHPSARSAQRTRDLALVVVVLLATAVGGWRSMAVAAGAHDPQTLRVAGVSYVVTGAEQVNGLTDADLGGMSHGVSGLVTQDHAMVRVSLLVRTGRSASSFDPSGLRVYPRGSKTGLAPVGTTLAAGRLAARSSIEGTLAFVVPRNGAQLELRADGDPDAVALLTVDRAASGTDDHAHRDDHSTNDDGSAPPADHAH